MKTCIRCSIEKSPAEFYSEPRNKKDGLSGVCRLCTNIASKEWRRLNPEKAKKANKLESKRHKSNPVRKILISAKYIAKKNKYAPPDITEESLAEMIKTRGICSFQGCIGDGICLDHDHKTGQVRGWLCGNHNTMLGLAGDREVDLEEGIKYLQRAKKNSVQVVLLKAV